MGKFEALLDTLSATPEDRARAHIAASRQDIQALLDGGISARLIVNALADDLQVDLDFVRRILRKFRSQKNPRPASVASVAEAKETAPVPTTKQDAQPTKRAGEQATKQVTKQTTKQATKGGDERSRSHPTLPNVELPDWADWSDQLPEESDADYIFRKALEMSPESQRKFIGEHNR